MKNLIGHKIIKDKFGAFDLDLKGKIIVGFELASSGWLTDYFMNNNFATMTLYYDLTKSKDAYFYLYTHCLSVVIFADTITSCQCKRFSFSLFTYDALEDVCTKQAVYTKKEMHLYQTKLKLCENIKIDNYEDFESVIYSYFSRKPVLDKQLHLLDNVWKNADSNYLIEKKGNKHRYYCKHTNLYSDWYEESDTNTELKRLLKLKFEYLRNLYE